jgi:hypothetical protein
VKRLSLGLVLLIAAVGVSSNPARAAGETGRIGVDSTMRIVDTRGSAPIAAGQDVVLDGAIFTVTAKVDRGGRIDTVACGSSSPGTPLIIGPPESDAGTIEFTQRTVVVSPGSRTCLRPTVPLAALIVDRHQSVSENPTVGGLQYVPLDEAVTLASGDFLGNDDGNVPKTYVLASADLLPADAQAATISIQEFAEQVGYVAVRDCTRPTMAVSASLTAGRIVASVEVEPGNDVCLDVYGDQRVRVELLGYLSTEGLDPTRLPPGTADAAVDLAPSGFEPISPVRLFDTRTDQDTDEDTGDDEVPVVPEDEPTVLFADLSEFTTPSTTAVTLNVTAARAVGKGFLTVWPCEDEPPTVSNLNFQPGPPVANLVTVRLYESSLICFGASNAVDLIADIAGTFESDAGALSTPVAPVRILDTRDGTGAALGSLGAGSTLTLQVAGRSGIPSAGVEAVTMNITSARSDGDGYLTLWPCDEERPEASSLNFNGGLPVANLATVKLSAAGTVCVYASAATDVIADVGLYYSGSSTSGFLDVVPERILDTREALGVATTSKLPANQPLVLQVAGRGGVPATGAVAVTMNVTAVNPDTGGFLTVWPCDRPQPNTSNLNFQANANVPNLVSVLLAPNGTVCISGSSTTHVLADVAGYTTSEPGRGFDIVLTPS